MTLLKKLGLIVALLLLCGTTAFAQKFGVINSSELIMAMPETDSVQLKMQQFQEEMASQLEIIEVEFNNKMNDLQKNLTTYTDAVKQLKERELQDLQTRYEEFQQTAQQETQNMYSQLMTPISTKAHEAIDKVGKANGFTLIFDLAGGSVVYQGTGVTDILPLVKTELGIQ